MEETEIKVSDETCYFRGKTEGYEGNESLIFEGNVLSNLEEEVCVEILPK